MYKTKSTYEAFLGRIDQEISSHPIILNNEYCRWFRTTDLTTEEVRNLTIQFSVFSNLFLVAELKKMVNAHSIESMRASKELLTSELATHEWILQFSQPLDLRFADLCKRRHGTPHTLFFCDELERLYGSKEYSVVAGASYAIQHWNTTGFWEDLHEGLSRFKAAKMNNLELHFFAWHNKERDDAIKQVKNELVDTYFDPDFYLDEELFIKSAKEMLSAVAVFWNGLNTGRIVSRYLENVR